MVDVEVAEVSKRFGQVVAVDRVSFSIQKGEFFSLLGPSGCGKTTTLRMLGGFDFPDSGDIQIAGKPMGSLPPYKRETNMVFQQLALFPHMDVYHNIAFGLQMKNTPRPEIYRRVHEVLDLVELSGFEKRRIDQLSGGQQQRVAIARAIINRPRVLLLDEPLGALDLKLRLQLQIELKKLQRELATTFIYVTHDQREAMTMSDRIAIMKGGRILQIGTPQEMYEAPGCKFVASFIGDSNMMEGTVVERSNGVVSVAVGDRIFHTSNHPGDLANGEKVWLSIRFERVKVGEEAGPTPNKVQGTVTRTIFRGATVEYGIETSDKTELRAEVPARGKVLPVASPVVAGWDYAAAVLVRDE